MSDTKKEDIHELNIPVIIDADAVTRMISFRGSRERLESTTRELLEKTRSMARPRGIYMIAQARSIDKNTVDVDGVHLTSRIMSRLFTTGKTVYPFISTIGKELDEMPLDNGDMWQRLCLDTIKTLVLVNGVDYLAAHIKDTYALEGVAHMNPGEIEDWAITQQKPLFSLFHGAEQKIGVTLTSGGAMKPIKSRSGIIFPDDTGFLSCRFCTQKKCPGRKAAYNPELVKEYLG
jgi:hypothetical protein